VYRLKLSGMLPTDPDIVLLAQSAASIGLQ
jgi:hypothetical protein